MRRHPRILAVDDQPANLALLRRVLEPEGFDVREARSGAEALAVVQETAPDLVLLDMHLPDMHGLDVLRRLRETPKGAAVRVAAMSALAGRDDREAWMRAGFIGVVEKPIAVKAFAQEIRGWLPGAKTAAPQEARAGKGTDRLGDLLVANLLITEEQLAQAVRAQQRSNKRLGQILVEQAILSEDDLAWALSHQLGYPYVFLTPDIVDPEAVRLLPEAFVRERRVLPILRFGDEMTLAMADPTDQHTVDDVTARTGLQVRRALALGSNIDEMLSRFFSGRRGFVPPGSREAATEAQYLQFHLVQALQQGGTEVHFDPAGDGGARVRYRLQGELVDRPAQSAELHAAIVRHLRELTGAGEAPAATAARTMTVGAQEVVFVATFVPTLQGESVTVALHPQTGDAPDLAALGLPGEIAAAARRALGAASGLALVGCADRWLRATLLHGLVPADQKGKVWALETLPVYRRSTFNQTVVAPSADLGGHLRVAASAGADLVVADDVTRRDVLAAAVDAARGRFVLAGHLGGEVAAILGDVIAAAGPAAASVLRVVLVARSIRLLCPNCRQPVEDAGGRRVFQSAGCEACGFTGFRGRRVLADAWVAEPETAAALRDGRAADALARAATSPGRMRGQAEALLADGLVSPGEVARVLDAT
ncbi:MAG: response regulator [Armatimonadota bacterium]|nr:response regulator [Armatimonadota bacterium]